MRRALALVALASCAGASTCWPAVDHAKVESCRAEYRACVDASHSAAEYAKCRDKVDAVCLPAGAGGHGGSAGHGGKGGSGGNAH